MNWIKTGCNFGECSSFNRLVPQIISFLASHLNKEQHNILLQYQGLVQKQIGLEREKEESAVPDAEKTMSEVKGQLEELLPKVKDVALIKKSASVSSD